jgi:5-methylcytosine-specific restriction endonuclease McrA
MAVSTDRPAKPCDRASCPREVDKSEREAFRRTNDYRAARARVNAGPKPSPCPACKLNANVFSPDHIIPVNIVHKMPGFACLSKADQDKVVNHPSNFVGLCRSCNSSKSDKLWHKWKGNQVKGIVFSDAMRKAAIELSGNLIVNLKGMVRAKDCA